MTVLLKKFAVLSLFIGACVYSTLSLNNAEVDSHAYTIGKLLYTQGLLPDGNLVKATIQGDIAVEGDQLICETCHRKSGMGSTEGQQVVPAVAGNLLFKPLMLPITKPPDPPVYREAYTRESLMVAIRDGIGIDGKPLDPFMPRYQISEESLDGLMVYLDTLSQTVSPGVTSDTIHFATVVASSNTPEENKALIDVMEQYVGQKNKETRYESKRAKNAPWHKEWLYKPYRKWQIHTWELKGDPESWSQQLDRLYQKQPVFALVNGYVPQGWEHVHDFCERESVPCLFPSTSMPVVDESDFYAIYLSKGAVQEADAATAYILQNPPRGDVIQIVDGSSKLSRVAGDSLRDGLEKRGVKVATIVVEALEQATSVLAEADHQNTVVLWFDKEMTDRLLSDPAAKRAPGQLIVSTLFYGVDSQGLPPRFADAVVFVHTSEMPEKIDRLLMRSTGWFKAKRIYNPNQKEIQANAYFALKVAGDAIKHIRGYFYRDYFIEKIEHVIDDLPYTSIYPRISMAPDQRFVTRGYYIAKIDGKGGIRSISDWIVP